MHPPDLVITGGVIPAIGDSPCANATATAARPTTVAVCGATITAVGGPELCDSLPASTRVIDARGGAILPGIHDGHLHFVGTAAVRKLLVPLTEARTWDEVWGILATATPDPSGWVRAFGWDTARLGPVPSERLAELRPDAGVVAYDVSGHGACVNGAGMRLTGLADSLDERPGRVVERDAQGRATGVFWDGALDSLNAALPPLDATALRAAVLAQQHELHALGLTAVTEPGLGPGGRGLMAGACGSAGLSTLLELAEHGKLTLRTTVLLLLNGTGGANAADTRAGLASDLPAAARTRGIDPQLLTIAGVKIFADGIPRAGTAWMSQPYDTGCGHGHGALTVAGDSDAERLSELTAILESVHDAGLQAGIHATGDATCAAVIDAVTRLQRRSPRDARHYLIHGAFRDPGELDRLRAAGMGYSTNPAIRAAAGAMMRTLLGESRFTELQPLRTALARRAHPNIASDAPVTDPDWRHSVIAAVTRDTSAGPGRADPERVSLAQALHMMTATPAWQDHADRARGSLRPGKLADICVLAEPLPDEVERLRDIPTSHTVVDGKVVYQAR